MAYSLRELLAGSYLHTYPPYPDLEVQDVLDDPDLGHPLPSRVVEGGPNRTSPIPRETPIFEAPEISDPQFPEPP